MIKKIIIGIFVFIIIGLIVDLPIDKCLDRGGAWDYKEWKCQEPPSPFQ